MVKIDVDAQCPSERSVFLGQSRHRVNLRERRLRDASAGDCLLVSLSVSLCLSEDRPYCVHVIKSLLLKLMELRYCC